jgi:nucleolar GTP-binding protein
MADAEQQQQTPQKRVHSSKSRGMSRGRSASLAAPAPNSGLRDVSMSNKALQMADKAQRRMNKMAKIGEADRCVGWWWWGGGLLVAPWGWALV